MFRCELLKANKIGGDFESPPIHTRCKSNSYFLAVFFAGAFFATFFAGAFFAGAAFLAGAFFAGISYPPFHSAVAEDKKFTTRLTNEQTTNRQ